MEARIMLSGDDAFTRANQALLELWDNRKDIALHVLEISEYKKKRSTVANNFYWACVVTPLANHLGYTPEELHEVLLAEIYGTKVIEFRGTKREVPNRRSHDMNTTEFAQHIEHCQRICAEQGVPVEPFQSGY